MRRKHNKNCALLVIAGTLVSHSSFAHSSPNNNDESAKPNFSKAEGDLQTNFDKWMYVLQQLPYLQNRPQALQDRVFQKLFEAAEIAKFTPDEKNKYEESLKYYRDLKNVVDTSFDEGKAEGKAEGKDERNIEIARQMKQKGMESTLISEITGLSIDKIEKLK